MRVFLSIAIGLLGLLPAASAQEVLTRAEVGIPFPSEHHDPSVYNHSPQNWAVTQDDRGVVYVANSDGVLEYDGARWRLISTAHRDSAVAGETARSLATGADGTIYVGTANAFGWLAPDERGRMQFQSLRDHVPARYRPVQDIWNTEATRDAVYFQSRRHIFRWDGTALDVIGSSSGFHTAFTLGNRFFVRELDRGLTEYVDGQLRLVPGGERFAETSIYVMAPYPDGRFLVGTATQGFWLFDGRDWRPFETEADGLLDRHTLYDGCALPDGHFAFATLGGGAVVINAAGHVVRHLRPARELRDGVVNAVYAGADGTLWLALNNAGLAHARVLSSVSLFGPEQGLQGTVRSLKRFGEALYVATGMGVYRLPLDDASVQRSTAESGVLFRRVEGVPIAFHLERTADGVLAGTQRGVYRIRGEQAERVPTDTPDVTYTLETSRAVPGRVYAGTRSGLRVLPSVHTARSASSRSWTVPGIDQKITSIYEAGDGSLWLGTATGVLRVQFPNGLFSKPDIQPYGTADGLPSNYSSMTGINGVVTAISKENVAQVVDTTASGRLRFAEVPGLLPGSDADGPLRSMLQVPSGDLIAARGHRVFRAKRAETRAITWASVDALHFPKGTVVNLFPDREGVIWMGEGARLFRHDGDRGQPVTDSFQAFVREMTTITDGVVTYGGNRPGGAGDGGGDTEGHTESDAVVIDYEDNDVRFHAAAPLFNTTTSNLYQFRLGREAADWSDWQAEPSVVYTNLFEGTYRLEVRAQNERGATSEVGALVFRVRPPWYRTGWAYAVYGLGVVLLGVWIRRYYVVVGENERQRERSEALTRERRANERLQQANRSLRQANDMKETFLASTSHELRTPLTSILGFSDLLRDETEARAHPFLDVIEANGRRLLRTLDALLDLASLRAGEMSPSLHRIDVCETVQAVAAEHEPGARKNNVTMSVDVPDRAVYALLDERYLEQILRNLVGNAIKFTEDGTVTVSVAGGADQVTLEVADTGIGIDPAFIPDLFRDFKQESQGVGRTYEGSGLGLAITARLVDLMEGTITVQSEKGEGSTFRVELPRRPSATTQDGRQPGTATTEVR